MDTIQTFVNQVRTNWQSTGTIQIVDQYTITITYEDGFVLFVNYVPDDILYQYYTYLEKPKMSMGYGFEKRVHVTFDQLIVEINQMSNPVGRSTNRRILV